MKKILICCCLIALLAACEAGKFTADRNRLHNLGRDGVCEKNPQRCIDGTNIEW